MYYRQSSEHFESEDLHKANAFRNRRAHVPDNPYSEMQKAGRALYVPAKPARRKGMLVKQPNVEDSPEKTAHHLFVIPRAKCMLSS